MRVNKDKSELTALMLQTFREHLKEVLETLDETAKLMQESKLSSVGPLGVSTMERSLELLLSASSVAINQARKQIRAQQREQASPEPPKKPTPEAKAGASVAKLIVKREKSPSPE